MNQSLPSSLASIVVLYQGNDFSFQHPISKVTQKKATTMETIGISAWPISHIEKRVITSTKRKHQHREQ